MNQTAESSWTHVDWKFYFVLGWQSHMWWRLIQCVFSSGWYFLCQMPPKRDAGAAPTLPPVKMIKIGSDTTEFGCDPMEDKYRLAEESSYSPFPNNEVRNRDLSVYNKNQPLFTITTRGDCLRVSYFAARSHWIWWRNCFQSRHQNWYRQSPHENRATAGSTQVWTKMQDFGREGAERAERWVGKMTNSLFTSYNSNLKKKPPLCRKARLKCSLLEGMLFLYLITTFITFSRKFIKIVIN